MCLWESVGVCVSLCVSVGVCESLCESEDCFSLVGQRKGGTEAVEVREV